MSFFGKLFTTSATEEVMRNYFRGSYFGDIQYELSRVILRGCEVRRGVATFGAGYNNSERVRANNKNVQDGLGRLPAGTKLTMNEIRFPNDVTFFIKDDKDKIAVRNFINSVYNTDDSNKNFNHSYQRAEIEIGENYILPHYKIVPGTNVANVLSQVIKNCRNDFERQDRLRVALTLLPRTNVENVGKFVQNFDTIYKAYIDVQAYNDQFLDLFIQDYRKLNNEENVQNFGNMVSRIANNLITPSTGQVQTTPQPQKQKVQAQQSAVGPNSKKLLEGRKASKVANSSTKVALPA